MKKTQVLVCLLAFGHLTLFSQTGKGPRPEPNAEESTKSSPPWEAPAALQRIYSNLGKKTEPFFTGGGGVLLSGPNSAYGSNFGALPFTPKSNAHVSQVQVAVEYTSGDNQVNLSIYGDSGGVPGTLLVGPVTVTNLPTHGTCCALAVANFTPVAVTGGTQYWVVADTPPTGTGSDFAGGWREVVKPIPFAVDRGSGWFADNGDTLVAGEVLGTIP